MNTTTHPFAPEEIMAFVDGELPADRAQALSAHIEQCAKCSALVTDHGGVSGLLAAWQVESIPERLTARVHSVAEGSFSKADILLGRALTERRFPSLGLILKVASVLAGVLVLLAISVPNMLRSRMAANEASAVGSLRTLNMAAVTYFDSYGHYPHSLENFGSSPSGIATENGAGLVDDVLAKRGRKSGYLFTYRSMPPFGFNTKGSYTINAAPLELGKGGQGHFSTDQTGTIFADGVELGGPSQPGKLNAQAAGGRLAVKEVTMLAETSPLIARTAELKLVVEKIDDARQGMDKILAQHQGYVAQLSSNMESDSTRMVIASLRVPADQLDACLAALKKLGRVAQESLAGEEVTQQHTDLGARLKNSRNTEARLNDVVKQHAGQVKDVLDVEKESARVRGEIEQMEAEQQTLEHRVNFATIDLKLAEEYKAQLTSPTPSVGMQLRNATVNGFRNASESLLGIILFFAESGPTFLLWLLILLIPARMLWRRYKRALVMSASSGA